MLHLTLTTGHIRRSPRSEVGDDVIEGLRPLVAAGGGPLAPMPGYRVTITRAGRDAMFTLWRGEQPVVTCALAVEDPAGVWRALGRVVGDTPMPAEVPWLAVEIHDVSQPEDLHWIADAERCLAWALMEETSHGA